MLTQPVVKEARTERGELDAVRLADLLGVSTAQVAQMIGRDPSNLRKYPDGKRYQGDLAQVEEVIALVREQVGSLEGTRMWLKRPNQGLFGRSPVEAMREGRTEEVLGLIYSVIEGIPG